MDNEQLNSRGQLYSASMLKYKKEPTIKKIKWYPQDNDEDSLV